MPRPEFVVSEKRPEEVAGACDFAVIEEVSGLVVIHNRSNGQGIYMTYHTQSGAYIGMSRAEAEFNDSGLTIWERPHGG